MSAERPAGFALWQDALLAAALLAIDPEGLRGAAVRAQPGPVRDAWLDALTDLLPEGAPVRRFLPGTPGAGLAGGLDLAATLASGRPAVALGLLAAVHGGVAVAAMAERLPPPSAALLGQVLDDGFVRVERDGLSLVTPTRFLMVAMDEGLDDERLAPSLGDRLAIRLDLGGIAQAAVVEGGFDRDTIDEARLRLPGIAVAEPVLSFLCELAEAAGAGSMRTPLFLLRVSCAAAALRGASAVEGADCALAARLVLGLVIPPPAESADETPDAAEPNPPDEAEPDSSDGEESRQQDEIRDLVLDAVRTSLPDELLDIARRGRLARGRTEAGKSGADRKTAKRGRQIGSTDRPGGTRLDLLATMRAAAPWQRLRRSEKPASDRDIANRVRTPSSGPSGHRLPAGEKRTLSAEASAVVAGHGNSSPRRGEGGSPPGLAFGQPEDRLRAPGEGAIYDNPPSFRLIVRKGDFRYARYQQRTSTTAICAVDASGSAAFERLAETKGAIEFLLSRCYARRDSVALLAFRGTDAQALLEPTRSLVRAKRMLAALPGGGGTPLASGILASLEMALSVRRKGGMPIVFLMTDGRGNVALDGSTVRERVADDVAAAARQFRRQSVPIVLIDTAARAQPRARSLAADLGADYLPLPFAGADRLAEEIDARMEGQGRHALRA